MVFSVNRRSSRLFYFRPNYNVQTKSKTTENRCRAIMSGFPKIWKSPNAIQRAGHLLESANWTKCEISDFSSSCYTRHSRFYESGLIVFWFSTRVQTRSLYGFKHRMSFTDTNTTYRITINQSEGSQWLFTRSTYYDFFFCFFATRVVIFFVCVLS